MQLMDIKSYIQAARLRTLPLSVSGIIVGSFLGNEAAYPTANVFTSLIFWLAILTTIGFQVLSNYANDYGDGVKGSDTNRTGEARMVASGKITAQQMKRAMILTAIITFFIALYLIYLAFGKENFAYSLIFIGLGIASIVAAIKYTVGNSAYGYSGFGDVFVFLFFGLLSVLGSYFLFTKQLDLRIVLPAISIGLLSTAVLNLNNLRDAVQDQKNNKRTLVVKLGIEKAKQYHFILIFIAFISSTLFSYIDYKSPFQFLFLIAFIPLIQHIRIVRNTTKTSQLDPELKKVALSTFLFSLLFAIGQTFF